MYLQHMLLKKGGKLFGNLHFPSIMSNIFSSFKAAYSVTMNIFEKNYFLFKSFVKVELSYVFTIKMFSTA